MTLKGCDISNHQSGADFDAILRDNEFVICKATEGINFVDVYCDGWVQRCRKIGKPWGFYHFGRRNDPVVEADYFLAQTENYFGEGIPILDWEDGQSVAWVNLFVERVHDKTSVWPWIYANPWRFTQGGVNANCGRWVAAYQSSAPNADIGIAAWQYTSTPYDKNLFYGDVQAWKAYAEGERNSAMGENEMIKAIYDEVMRTDDPTGRGYAMRDHDHIKWIAAGLQEINTKCDRIIDALGIEQNASQA